MSKWEPIGTTTVFRKKQEDGSGWLWAIGAVLFLLAIAGGGEDEGKDAPKQTQPAVEHRQLSPEQFTIRVPE